MSVDLVTAGKTAISAGVSAFKSYVLPITIGIFVLVVVGAVVGKKLV